MNSSEPKVRMGRGWRGARLLFLALGLTTSSVFGGPVIYVNQAGTGVGDGSSWTDGYTDLQPALDAAGASGGAIREIWVAKGTYKPSKRTDPNDPRSATFQLLDGVALYGGFAGIEASVDQRDIDANPTILSGDLNGDDQPGFVNYEENARHVLTALGTVETGTTIIDGLTIMSGYARSTNYLDARGGALYLQTPYAIISNCTFSRNFAGTISSNVAHSSGGGAAVYVQLGFDIESPHSSSFYNCRFIDNETIGTGAAVFLSSGDAAFKDCFFQNNKAGYGGAIGTESARNVTLLSSVFLNNTAEQAGGALAGSRFSLVIENCQFEGNIATSGGAVYQRSGSAMLTKSEFVANTSYSEGGAVYLRYAREVTLTDCLFASNVASSSGGGAYIYTFYPITLSHCEFLHNTAQGGGGGALWLLADDLTVANCRFEQNEASEGGGAAVVQGGQRVVIRDSIFADNAAGSGSSGALQVYGAYAVEFTDDEFRGNSAYSVGGVYVDAQSTIAERCQFIDNVARRGSVGGLELVGGRSDKVTECSFVNNRTPDRGGGMSSGGNAILKDCVFSDNYGGRLGGGLYVHGSSSLTDCRLENNRADSGGGLFVDGSAEVTRCTFDGNSATTNGGGIYGSDSDFRYDRDIRLTEVTFSGNEALVDGGGLYDSYSKAHLQDCTFSRNAAGQHGGALFYKLIKGTVTESAFQDNTAHAGGAVYNYGFYDPVFFDCSFIGNTAAVGGAVHNYSHGSIYAHCTFIANGAGSGGAIYNQEVGQEHPLITNDCLFAGNSSTLWGGAVANVFGYATLSDCIFSGNSAGHTGGGLYNYPFNGRVELLNCTFSQNTAALYGGGVYNSQGQSLITNAIVWGNSANESQSPDAQISTLTNVSYSMIEGLPDPTGTNTGDDPMFVDPDGPDDVLGTADDDLRLQPDSPAINAGDPEFVSEVGETDPDGHPRVLCGRVDMGAYEFRLTGDVDCDRDVDISDFSEWPECMGGPFTIRPSADCAAFDFDADGDIDLRDAAALFRAFSPTPP